jgi:hypothetical protein
MKAAMVYVRTAELGNITSRKLLLVLWIGKSNRSFVPTNKEVSRILGCHCDF